ncbi:MAG: retropepsin-like aspartic protease [Gemmataceae bacterium]
MPFINGLITADGPIIEIFIGPSTPRAAALKAAGQQAPNPVPARALIDTGASGTVIDKRVIQKLGLAPTGSVAMHTPSTGSAPQICYQYDVAIWFIQPQMQPRFHLMSMTIPVIESDFSAHSIQALVGRDLLSRCMLFYNGSTSTFAVLLKPGIADWAFRSASLEPISKCLCFP